VSEALTLSEAAGQVLVVGYPAAGMPQELRRMLRQGALGGVVLFKRNLGTHAEVAAQVADVVGEQSASLRAERPLLVAVDQEGGRVERVREPPVLRLPPMRAFAAAADPALIRRAAAALAAQLRALGFTMNFAPVLDVDTNPDNPVIGDRAFGRTADEVVRAALPFSDGLADAGLLACGKHFPGHGDTHLDSHHALPVLAHARPRLDEVELAPFRAARGRVPSLMTAHVVFEALDPEVPATLSRRVITGLLRDELGYDGVVYSDDLEMQAIAARVGVGEAATAAIDAGCDAVLVCSDPSCALTAHEALVRRAEADPRFAARLREAAARHLWLRRSVPGPSPVTDAAALERALDTAEVRAVREQLAQRLSRGWADVAVDPTQRA
jgi:beta-N-acetylhexosaminidase